VPGTLFEMAFGPKKAIMARMPEERYPCQALFSHLRGAKHSRVCPT